MSEGGSTFLGFYWLAVFAFIYFLPALIARQRKHHNKSAIAAVNILLGWTIVGWLWAFIWSLMRPAPVVVQAQAAPATPEAALTVGPDGRAARAP